MKRSDCIPGVMDLKPNGFVGAHSGSEWEMMLLADLSKPPKA